MRRSVDTHRRSITLVRLAAASLVASTACIFPLVGDPAGTDGEPDSTGVPDPTTGPAPGPTTGSSTGNAGTTGWPDDHDSLVPIVTPVWAFDAMDLGDVDGDGRLDLVTSGTGSPPRVTVYPGRGDGTFDPDAAVETELFAFTAFVLGDVTGDGHADVLTHGTGSPPRVTVHAGRPDLGFTALATTELVAFVHMHAGDMNLDGRADLLIGDGDAFSPWVEVWPGGDAGIGPAPLFHGESWRYDLLRSGDVDGDGRPDLVTASTGFTPQLHLHPGDGAGGFGEPVTAEIHTFSRFDLGDLDGDGRGDAVTDVPGNAWRFQLYRAVPGGWSEPAVRDGFNFTAFELGDLDGDGRADLVTRPTGEPPRVEVYLSPAP